VRQLLAVVAALLMVGAALIARSAIDDDNGNNGNGGDGSTPTLLCAAELGDVCDELARSEDIDVFKAPMDAVASDSDMLREYDGWLTFERNAERVSEARVRSSLDRITEEPSDPIARSPVVIAIAEERADVLATQCGGDVTWQCIGDVAGEPWQSIGGSITWGEVKPAHADPESTGEGLVIIGEQAAHFFGTTDLSRDNFDEDEFLEWFTRLERSTKTDSNAFQALLTSRSATYDVVATLEARADESLAQREDVRLIYPAPVATADVVFIQVVDGDDDLADIVTGDAGQDALRDAGFRVDDDERNPPLSDGSRLPSAGVLEALLQTWREVTG